MGKAKLFAFFDFFRFLFGIDRFLVRSGARMEGRRYTLKYRPLSAPRMLKQ